MARLRPRALGVCALSLLLGLAAACAGFRPGAAGGSAAPTSPVLSRIVESGTLRVGMSGSQPPLNFRGRSGEMLGMEVDLARALASSMEAELQIVRRPFGQLLAALEAGEVDLVMSGMTITPRRNLRAAFVGPYYVSGKSILTTSEALARAEGPGDLDDPSFAFAALEGSTSERFVEAFLPKARLVVTPDYDTAVARLRAGEVDALVADREIVLLTALRHPSQEFATLRRPLTIEPIGVAAPPGDPLLVNFLENALGALEASETLELLRRRWLTRGDWVRELPETAP